MLHWYFVGATDGSPAWQFWASQYFKASHDGRQVVADFCSGACSLEYHKRERKIP